MIRQILLNTRNRKELYKNIQVCGCVYRSFNDLEACIFFRFAINNNRLSRQQIQELLPQAERPKDNKNQLNENYQKIKLIIEVFRSLEIVRNFDNTTFEMYAQFVNNVEKFIKDSRILEPVNLNNKPQTYEPKPFQFLQILFEGKLPQNCRKLEAVKPYARALTKQQFLYIKSDISYKIGILINGIINSSTNKESQNISNIQNLIKLNLLDSRQYYLKDESLAPIIKELAKIKLVQIGGNNGQYFRISKYLEHFTFKNAQQRNIDTKLNCRIIIETNFKVFAVIKSQEPRQNKVIKSILAMLLKSQSEGVQYDQLFIGQINIRFMKEQIFGQTKITTNQYFDFFKQYTDQSHALQKDLGKWKKLKFIGLEGPSQDSNIPSNIKQEVKLWEHLKDIDDYEQKQF